MMEIGHGCKFAACWKPAQVVCMRKNITTLVSMLSFLVLVVLGLSVSIRPEFKITLTPERESLQSKDPLEAALERVSMGKNTVIITTINKAYTANNSLLDFFIHGLRHGIGTEKFIHQILFAAFDEVAFNQCQARGLHCYNFNTAGAVDYSREEVYMSPGFLKMMWGRTIFLTDVLSRGYNILFTDADILWLRNPFRRLSAMDDVQVSCDRYRGGPYAKSNELNAGFFFVRSNKKTIELFKLLCESRNIFKFLNEQDMLKVFKKAGVFRHLRLKFRYLDPQYFSGFCQKSKNWREVTTMHANCVKSVKKKMGKLRSYLVVWEIFMSRINQTNYAPPT